MGKYNFQQTANKLQSIKYITKGEKLKKFETSVTQEITKQLRRSSWEEDNKALDKYISSRNANMEDIDNKFSDALRTACNKSLKIRRASIKK